MQSASSKGSKPQCLWAAPHTSWVCRKEPQPGQPLQCWTCSNWSPPLRPCGSRRCLSSAISHLLVSPDLHKGASAHACPPTRALSVVSGRIPDWTSPWCLHSCGTAPSTWSEECSWAHPWLCWTRSEKAGYLTCSLLWVGVACGRPLEWLSSHAAGVSSRPLLDSAHTSRSQPGQTPFRRDISSWLCLKHLRWCSIQPQLSLLFPWLRSLAATVLTVWSLWFPGGFSFSRGNWPSCASFWAQLAF